MFVNQLAVTKPLPRLIPLQAHSSFSMLQHATLKIGNWPGYKANLYPYFLHVTVVICDAACHN